MHISNYQRQCCLKHWCNVIKEKTFNFLLFIYDKNSNVGSFCCSINLHRIHVKEYLTIHDINKINFCGKL